MSMSSRAEESPPLAAGERMDHIYRYQRHIYDLTRRYFLIGRDRLVAGLEPPHGGTVLEIGCGTARNLVAAARRYPNARCFGVDISSEMLRSAAGNLRRAGLDRRIRLAEADACAFDPKALFGVPRFDRVFFSYTLSMVPNWQEALAAAKRLLAPNGRLLVVDFGQQERLPAFFRTALFAWIGLFDVIPRAELRAELAELALDAERLRFTTIARGYAWLAELTAGP